MNTETPQATQSAPVFPAKTAPEYPTYGGAPAVQPSFTKVRSLDAISTAEHRSLKNEVVNILTAAHRHGIPALCVGEIAAQFQRNTGQFKPPSSFSAAISGLRSSKLIEVTGERFFPMTGKMQDAYALVPKQARLVG